MASESLNEVDRLREEFRMLVLSVTCGLEGVKITCGDLRRTSVGAETLTFIRLEITILELLASSEKLRTPASVLRPSQVAHDCRKTLDGFAKEVTSRSPPSVVSASSPAGGADVTTTSPVLNRYQGDG
ncbi:hypothetical protein F2P81_016377 [Scophthalmus maximus]|uniref:Uncharacterized protein n=1 Tax=Scophthalmus maximus TaxID=52904 RepID=A0A6A4SND9_SCOMX|nr:hypothetical protein F2P81_016377 [Scophthalmus maximus]